MTRFLRFSCVMLVVTSLQCFADSIRNISNVNASLVFLPNYGSGDNVGGTLVSREVNLMVGGGTPYDWFPGGNGFAPGSGAGGSTTIYFDSAVGTIGNRSYDGNLIIDAADFNADGFTLPTDGSGFTISVPESIGVIVLQGCDDKGCITYNVTTKPGTLTMSFFSIVVFTIPGVPPLRVTPRFRGLPHLLYWRSALVPCLGANSEKCTQPRLQPDSSIPLALTSVSLGPENTTCRI